MAACGDEGEISLREVSQAEQDAALDVLRRNEDRLRGFKGVHYIDIGFRYVNGQPTDELAIRVHVHEKRLESELAASEIVPEEVEGVPIDVIQSNPQLQQNPRDQRFDPLVGGIAARNTRHPFFGTLGAVVFDAVSGAQMGLSNHHVFVGNTGQAGDNIAQPATVNQADVIGTLTRWSLQLDAAVCTLNNSRVISTGIVDFPGDATGAAEPLVGTGVAKSGRTTGTTFGIIDGVSSTEFTVVPDPNRPAPGGEISMGGDSGSVWLRVADSAAIGLHYAGEADPDPAAERAWAHRMVNIVQALNIELRPRFFGQFILQTGTVLHETDETFAFAVTDWDGDGRPDLVAIKKSGTGTNSTEVHILSGASDFQQFILQTGTVLHETDETFAFAVTDWDGDGRPDLVAIKKSGTGTNSTEVHILRG